MKKMIFLVALTIPLMAGIMFTGYRSSTQKQKAAQAKMQAENTAEKAATAEEWKTFKSESELKIKDNEILITELKVKMEKQEEILDALYKKKIANLEEQIKYMKVRLEAFEKSHQSNWESFKLGFNQEMDTIGNALKYLTVDNNK